jgi:hypothetical protein
VTTTVVSHETTLDIAVWAPDAEGPWPIVYALHGLGGKGQDLAVTATELASHGNVMFAPDWGSEQTAECSYRYSVSIAEDCGGDPDQPITAIGHSAGASAIRERRSRSPERIRPARIEAYECPAVALFHDPLSTLSRSVVT